MLKKSKQILDTTMFVAHPWWTRAHKEMQFPDVSLYVAHMLFKTNIVTLADQLNVLFVLEEQGGLSPVPLLEWNPHSSAIHQLTERSSSKTKANENIN